MPDFKPTEDVISMSEFRNTLADCVARTRKTQRPLFLTQNGRATSVFLDAATWEKIQEKLYNGETCEDFLVAEDEADRGETFTPDEVVKHTDDALEKLLKAKSPKKCSRRREVA